MASFPKTFLYLMSLRNGAELITLSLLINKVSGVYGILAILTGYELSWVQLSMYTYSIIVFVLGLLLFSSIRAQDPLRCLSLAYLYTIDSIINAAYTVTFGVAWFLMLATHPDKLSKVPGAGMINDTAGLTSPEYDVDRVEVPPTIHTPEETVPYVNGNDSIENASSPGRSSAVFESGSITSVAAIAFLWMIRIYFILVLLSYARTVLRIRIAKSSMEVGNLDEEAKDYYSDRSAIDDLYPGISGWRRKISEKLLAFGNKGCREYGSENAFAHEGKRRSRKSARFHKEHETTSTEMDRL